MRSPNWKQAVTHLLFATLFSAFLLNGIPLRAGADNDYLPGQTNTLQRTPTLDIELAETPLPAALELIKKQIGSFTFVFEGDQSNYGKITLSVHNKPVNSVLELIARSAGADIWVKDGVYVIGPQGSRPLGYFLHDPAIPTKTSQIPIKVSNVHRILQQLIGTSDPANGVVARISTPHLLDQLSASSAVPSPDLTPVAEKEAANSFLFGSSVFCPSQPGEMLRGLLPEGIRMEEMEASPAKDVLAVQYVDTPKGNKAFRQLQEQVARLDIRQNQIQVNARFITMSHKYVDRLGLDWKSQKVDLVGANSMINVPQVTATMRYAVGNLESKLASALKAHYVTITDKSTVSISDQIPIRFTNTTRYHGLEEMVLFINRENGDTHQNVAHEIAATSVLNVYPHLNADGTITLSAYLIFTDLVKKQTDVKGQILAQWEQLQSVMATLHPGETMVIRGLSRDERNLRNIKPDAPEVLVFLTATESTK